jgi:hypothetical protein
VYFSVIYSYLKNQIQTEEKHRFHFFNSFFFRKLADLDKDPSSIADGKAAFLRVRKWTRKVDMFGKDYIFVPVNYNLHWSLIVICHPGEVANRTDLDLDDSKKVPCILHMDSIKGSHAGLKNLVQTYVSSLQPYLVLSSNLSILILHCISVIYLRFSLANELILCFPHALFILFSEENVLAPYSDPFKLSVVQVLSWVVQFSDNNIFSDLVTCARSGRRGIKRHRMIFLPDS